MLLQDSYKRLYTPNIGEQKVTKTDTLVVPDLPFWNKLTWICLQICSTPLRREILEIKTPQSRNIPQDPDQTKKNHDPSAEHDTHLKKLKHKWGAILHLQRMF